MREGRALFPGTWCSVKPPPHPDEMVAPTVWGPPLWKSLHFIALGYPSMPTDEDRQAYGAFFANLHAVIPCVACAVNYRRHLDELPVEEHLDGPAELFAWTVALHNMVNIEKDAPAWTVAQARAALMPPAPARAPRPDSAVTFKLAGVSLDPGIMAVVGAILIVLLTALLYGRATHKPTPRMLLRHK